MRRFTALAAAFAAFAAGLPTAHSAIILLDKFDSYANQAAFEAAWTPIGTTAPISADLSTANPNQVAIPDKSVEVDGEPNAPTGANNKQRNQRTFAETGGVSTTQNMFWSFDFYDSNAAAAPYRQYSNLQDTTAPGGTNQLLSMGLNNNQTVANSGGNYYMARILGYNPTAAADPDGGPAESVGGSGAYFKLNDFGVGLRSTGWHNLRVVMSTNDGLSTDFDFYVDGVLAERVHNVGTAATIRSYDNIRIGSGLTNGNNAAQYDNMRLQTGSSILIPEPSSIMLVGLSLVGAAFAARRRAA
jgi:hypothetical protein